MENFWVLFGIILAAGMLMFLIRAFKPDNADTYSATAVLLYLLPSNDEDEIAWICKLTDPKGEHVVAVYFTDDDTHQPGDHVTVSFSGFYHSLPYVLKD